jgi:RNA polymerase sigma-70 factor (ECF subfamily)
MSIATASAGPRGAGDAARFRELYDRGYRPIRDYCARRVPIDAVDDAVADTFLTVWRRLDEIPNGDAGLVWAYRVAYRVVGHVWRSNARQRRLQHRLSSLRSLPDPATDEHSDDADESRVMLAALARLDGADAELLRLVTWDQLPVGAIAEVLGIAPDAVRQRLHRARANLAREYSRLRSRRNVLPVTTLGGAR